MTAHNAVTTNNFAESSDEAIREAARALLRTVPEKDLRPKFRRMMRTGKGPIEDFGGLLWAHLCKWTRGGLSDAVKKGGAK